MSHLANVPSLKDFRPPWITEDGTETEIDKDNLKKYVHNLTQDKARAQDARDEAKSEAEAAVSKADELQALVDAKDPDLSSKLKKAEDKARELETKLSKADLRATRIEVAVEAGLTVKQAKRLQGETKEELEADAKELAEDLGIEATGGDNGDNGKDDDDDDEIGTRPQVNRNLTGGGTRPQAGPQDETDYEKVAATLMPGTSI